MNIKNKVAIVATLVFLVAPGILMAQTQTKGGKLTGSISAGAPQASYLGMGITGIDVAQYQFSADNNSSETLTKLTILDSASAATATPTTHPSDFINYRLTDAKGNVLGVTAEQSGVLTFYLTGLVVPLNSTEYVNLVADTNSYPYAHSGGTHAYELQNYQYTNGSMASTTNVSFANGIGNLFTVYQTTLGVTGAPFANPSSISTVGNAVGGFTVTAGSGNFNPIVKTVTLFTAGSVIQSNTAQVLGLYDASTPSVLLASSTLTGTGSATFNISATNANQWMIPYNSSKTLLVKILSAPTNLAAMSKGATGDYQVLLKGLTWTDGVTASITGLSPSIAMPIPSQNITGLSTVAAPPSITALSPTSGPLGSNITITGSGFTTSTSNSVYADGALMPGPYTQTSDGKGLAFALTKEIAFESGAAFNVYVTNVNGTSNVKSFTVIPGVGAPTITTITPSTGSVGTQITIHGTNLTGGIVNFYNQTNQLVASYGQGMVSTASNGVSVQFTLRGVSNGNSMGTPGKYQVEVNSPIGNGQSYPLNFTLIAASTTPAPTATLSANPTKITAGSSTTLTWSSTNAVSCTGTSAGSSWTGNGSVTNLSATGSQVITPIKNTILLPYSIIYQLTCTGPGGTSTPASATVAVTKPITANNNQSAIISQSVQDLLNNFGTFFKSL